MMNGMAAVIMYWCHCLEHSLVIKFNLLLQRHDKDYLKQIFKSSMLTPSVHPSLLAYYDTVQQWSTDRKFRRLLNENLILINSLKKTWFHKKSLISFISIIPRIFHIFYFKRSNWTKVELKKDLKTNMEIVIWSRDRTHFVLALSANKAHNIISTNSAKITL